MMRGHARNAGGGHGSRASNVQRGPGSSGRRRVKEEEDEEDGEGRGWGWIKGEVKSVEEEAVIFNMLDLYWTSGTLSRGRAGVNGGC